MGDLSDHFSRWEFRCKCGCGFDDVKPFLVSRLEHMRRELGRPIHINSGCRCVPYNHLVGGVDQSEHTYGSAADLQCGSSSERFDLCRLALGAGFNRIGIGKTFIHVGIAEDKPQRVIWLY